MKKILKLSFIILLTTLFLYSNIPSQSADPFLGHLQTSSHFDIWYTNDFSGKPLHAVTHNAVDDFVPVLEAIRSADLGLGFDNPYMRMVKVFDQGGINARGGYWGMKFDPYFLDVIDEDANHSATLVEKYAVALHEYFHVIQYHYFWKSWEARKWIIEGNARCLQDKLGFEGVDIDATGDHFASYYGEVNGYLGNPNRNLFKASYAAALFWNYVCEQFGSLTTEPESGADALVDLWEAAQHRDGHWRSEISCFNKMMDRLGYGNYEFEDVLANFMAANYLKDIPGMGPMYIYQDELQDPGPYRKVKLRRNISMDVYDSVVDTDYVYPYGAQYYRFIFEGADQATGLTEYPVNVQVRQISRNDMIYQLIIKDGKTGDYRVGEFRSKDLDVTEPLVPGSEIVLIVSSLKATDSDPARYHYAINAHGTTTLNLISPLGDTDAHRAKAGVHNDPEKILVTMNVFGDGLEVIRGIDREDFHVSIGGFPANVTAVHEEYGLYFLEVQPPIQPADGKYDLTISYSDASLTEPEAVLYWNIISDMVTVIDASGSMKTDGKIDAAKVASQVYLSSAHDSDLFGIVFFDENAKFFSEGLFDVGTYRAALQTNLSTLGTYSGGTSVGDGIYTANDWIYRYGQPTHEKVMVVLSDGRENEPKSIWDVDQLLWDGTNNTILNAVVLGPDANGDKLDPVARVSGGLVLYGLDNTTGLPVPMSLLKQFSSNYKVSSDNSLSATSDYPITSILSNYYRILAEDNNREQRVYANAQVLDGSWNLEEKVTLAQAKSATFVISYRGETLPDIPELVLLDPSDNKVPISYSQQQTGLNGDTYGHIMWKIANPVAGSYTFAGNGVDEFEYFTEVAIRSPLTMQDYYPLPGYVPQEETNYRVTGCEFPMVVTLSGLDEPVIGAEVIATVSTGDTIYDAQFWDIKLYDDGNHGDGFANDGVYSNRFTRTVKPGMYQIEINAKGKYNGAEFSRQALSGFYLALDDDQDKDGLYKQWEERHNLDDTDGGGVNGPSGDPDGDGLSNEKELHLGIYPRLLDTDAGGESDDSEVQFERDPWFYEDDGLFPPEIHGIPHDEMISIFYSNRTEYASLDLYRTDDLTLGFTKVASGLDPDLSNYNDTGLTNGHTYYYRMRAVGQSGELSGFSEVIEVVPALEQPEGFMLINKGDKFTNSPNVELLLYGDENVTEYRVSLDSSFAGAIWKPYTRTVPFTLASTEGIQTVFIQFRDAYGTIGGHDSGKYGFDGIILDYSYVPPAGSGSSSSSATSSSSSSSDEPIITPIDPYAMFGAFWFFYYLKKKKTLIKIR